MTAETISAHIVVPGDAPRAVWMLERGEGVTASEVWEIARGGIKTWRRILEAKMNGSRFTGNKSTRAGHAREDALLDEAAEQMHVVAPNSALWAAADNDLHRATPDGIGRNSDGSLVVVEVKSHEFGWENDGIPVDHYAQMQWQMRVLAAASGLYGWEVRDEDDMPPAAGAHWVDVLRDEEMIAYLVDRANAFIAWRDAGCPDVDDLPDDVEAARAEWVPVKRKLDEATRAEKTANAALKKAIAKMPHAARFGAVGMGADGGFQALVSETVSIDETAWRESAPEAHARAQELRVELALIETAAKRAYPKVRRTTSLRFQEAD